MTWLGLVTGVAVGRAVTPAARFALRGIFKLMVLLILVWLIFG